MLYNPKNSLFIGKKPIMTYVTSAILQLSALPSINVKARGVSIGIAVDVVQILLRNTNTFAIDNVKIGSELLESLDGKTRNVSNIEIQVVRTA